MPGWLQDTFLSDYAAELTMLLIGLGLLLLIAAALRRRSRGRDESIAETAQRPRIAVLEWAVVDEKRRLVLIQRDEAAHLVMIGGPTDVVIEANIGLPGRATTQVPASQAGYAASRPLTAAASAPVAIEPARAEAAPAPQAALPAAPALEAPLPSAENRQAEAPPAPHAERAPNPSVPAVADPVAAKPAPKPRPPLAAVPAAAAPQGESGRNIPAAAAPDLPGPKRAVAAAGEPHRSAQSGEMRAGGAASRLTPARKEPSLGTGGTSRWAGPGQSAQLTVGEPANTQDRTARDAGNRVQPGPGAPVPANVSGEVGNWTEGDDIEGEIVRALRTDPFPPLAFPAGNSAAARPDPAMPELKIAGTATASPGTTLGDLAEKLEEALAREVRSASHGRTRLDLDLDAFTMHGGVAEPTAAPTATLPPAPTEPGGLGAGGAQHRGPAAANQVAPVRQAHLSAAPTPEARRETQAAIDQQDDPPVISLSARRREIGDPLEDEMARLLGELTDGARR